MMGKMGRRMTFYLCFSWCFVNLMRWQIYLATSSRFWAISQMRVSATQKMLILSSDQMKCTSWGCEGVFLWWYDSVCVFVMWQEVVTCGGGGCCQMIAPGGTMCEEGVGVGVGGGRYKRHTGEEERRLYTTNRSPFPLQLSIHTSS